MFKTFDKWVQDRVIREDAAVGSYLVKAAQTIKDKVGDNTIVILGRDAWPLVPLLRRLGVKTQYFLYSRLQLGDKSTQEAWLREVPKGSYVLDTGYAGSILDDIKTFDPSIKGILMSSSGGYPELEVPETDKGSRARVVGNIEEMPKIITRSKGFHGYAAKTIPRKVKDDDVDSYNRTIKTSEIMQRNKRDLIQLGLSDQEAEKYKKFSGVGIKERIGTDATVSHLMSVGLGRRKETDSAIAEKDRKGRNSPEGLLDRLRDELQRMIDTGGRGRRGSSFDWKDASPGERYAVKHQMRAYAQSLHDTYSQIVKDIDKELLQITEKRPWDRDSINDATVKLKEAKRTEALLRNWLDQFKRENTSPYYGY